MKITIIGSGSWGVALAVHLVKLGHEIRMWSYSQEETKLINNQRKCKFLPNIRIPQGITCFLEFKEAIENSDIILHVTPSKATRNVIEQYKLYVKDQPVIMCSKGFEAETLYTLDEVLKEELPSSKIGALSGPSHAEEVSIGVPTALVIASEYQEVCEMVKNNFACPDLRIYTSRDVKGVELGGGLKNIIAFCAGVAAGMELGDNTFAALITRGLVEISRLGVAMGGQQNTFYGLTGLGDLIVTCLSEHSRNRKAGLLIGKGATIEEAKKEVGQTIESIDNIEIAYKLMKKYQVHMPIVETVYEVLFCNLSPQEAVKRLMTRDLREE